MWQKILVSIVLGIAKKATEIVWDSFWDAVDRMIVVAEQRWQEAGNGKEKKKFVMDFCLDYLNSRVELNWYQKFAMKLFLGSIIDKVIAEVNEDYEDGGWVKHTRSLKNYLEKYIPLLQ